MKILKQKAMAKKPAPAVKVSAPAVKVAVSAAPIVAPVVAAPATKAAPVVAPVVAAPAIKVAPAVASVVTAPAAKVPSKSAAKETPVPPVKREGVLPPAVRPKAATNAAAILGRPLAKTVAIEGTLPTWLPITKVKPEFQKFYQNLLELHDRLRRQMSGLAKESQSQMESYSLHMGDSGTDNFDRDFALSLLSSDQDAIYEIEEALKRIEKGFYGVCEQTQKIIPKARLEAIPWARYSVEAQAQLEKEGLLRQRNRLGSLGSVESGSAADTEDDDGDVEEKPSKEKEN